MSACRQFPASLVLLLVLAIPATGRAAPEGVVVASIKPVHSLVSMVMQGVGEPHLIVDGAASPHTYSLKPSDAAAIEDAAAVFWIGSGLEAFLARPLRSLGAGRIVALADAPGLEKLAFREAGPFEAHGDEHDDGHEAEHAGEKRHHHDDADLHLWLDPLNARAMLAEIARVLAEVDPENADRYTANAEAAASEISALQAEIERQLAAVRGRPFVVFHDAYQYFERRFGVVAAGSITVSPETMPGAKRVAEVRDKIEHLGAVCVFTEPQFEPRLVHAVAEGTPARSGVLDPLGADLPAGRAHYPQLLRAMATSLKDCLSGGG